MKTERAASASGACGIQGTLIECQVACWSSFPHHRHQIILGAYFIRCRASLLTASSHFFACSFTLLPCYHCTLASPYSPFPAAITGLGTTTPMAPLIPLAIGCTFRVIALSAFCPRPSAFRASMGSCSALPTSLLSPIRARH